MKKKYVIGIILILFLVSIIVFSLHLYRYSLLDINADNYLELLTENKTSIDKSGIDDCIPDKINLTVCNHYAPSDNFMNNGLKVSVTHPANKQFLSVDIVSSFSGILYTALFKNRKPYYCNLLERDKMSNRSIIKKIINNLILKEGFVLKKSEYVNGHDILVKETKNDFIIVRLFGHYDNSPVGFEIKTFSTRKFYY